MEIYVKDTYSGYIHKLGTNCHDSLYVNSEGHIDYLNLQICEGTEFGSYIFCDEKGNDLKEWKEDFNYIAIGAKIEDSQKSYNKGIDDFAELLKGKLVRKYANSSLSEQYVAMQVTDWCNEITEQLKAGGENATGNK